MANLKLQELEQIVVIETDDNLLINDTSAAEGSRSKRVTIDQLDDRYLAFNPTFIPYGELWQKDNAVLTDIITQGVFVKVLNFNVGETNLITGVNNELTISDDIVHTVSISISALTTANRELEFSVFVNGIENSKLNTKRLFNNGSIGSVSITGLLNASADDVLDLRVRNNSGNDDITVTSCNFNIVGI